MKAQELKTLGGFLSMRLSVAKFYSFLILTAILTFGCSNTQQTEKTDANANTVKVSTSEKDLPPGFSTSPLPTQGETPGIPAPNAVNSVPKGATPTPGIPDPKELSKPFKPGKTPTPGIPDEETLRRQLNTPVDPSIVNQPSSNQRKQERDE
ncbi:MAG: hypothetical protein D6687_03215 [Acidobacteria bacterium]|nr:MAG: hypothetical protein D6687_03215 [Acidobacteriota bacterium]